MVAIFIVALVLRLLHLSERPFHNDEGVNYFFLTNITEKGYYPYSHENYHGPTFFYWSYLWFSLIGDSEVGIRFSAVLSGLLTLPLLLFLKRSERPWRVLLMMAGIALLPSHVYYSRYAIHETLFVLSSLGVGLCAYRWLTHRENWVWYPLGIFAAIHCATKETFIISYFCLFFPVVLLAFADGIGKVFLDLKRQWSDVAVALVIFVFFVIGFFSGGFRWWEGVHEMVLAVPQWIGRNKSDTGHFKPFIYYTKVILLTEPWILGAGVLPLFILPFAIGRKTAFFSANGEGYRLPIFLSLWTFICFLVYSFLNYKTPWLIINISVPAALATIAWLTSFQSRRVITGVAIILVLCAGESAWGIWQYSFKKSYGDGNPYSYVHTCAGMLELTSDVDHYLLNSPKSRILVGAAQYWPLPYYLRNHADRLMYLNPVKHEEYENEYDVLILDRSVEWDPQGWAKKYYRLSDVQESYTYFKRK